MLTWIFNLVTRRETATAPAIRESVIPPVTLNIPMPAGVKPPSAAINSVPQFVSGLTVVSGSWRPAQAAPQAAPAKAKESIMATAPVVPAPTENLAEKIESKIVNVIDWIGVHAEDALKDVQPFLVPAETLVSILFPTLAPAAATAVSALNLIQSTIALVEQKYAALNLSASTPASVKLADTLSLVTPAVQSLLSQAGLTYSTTQVSSVVAAVNAILQAQTAATPAA